MSVTVPLAAQQVTAGGAWSNGNSESAQKSLMFLTNCKSYFHVEVWAWCWITHLTYLCWSAFCSSMKSAFLCPVHHRAWQKYPIKSRVLQLWQCCNFQRALVSAPELRAAEPCCSLCCLGLNMITAVFPSLSPGRSKRAGFFTHSVRRSSRFWPGHGGPAGMFLLHAHRCDALTPLRCTCRALGKQQPAADRLHRPQPNCSPNTGVDLQ